MKKLIALALLLVHIIGFAGCSKQEKLTLDKVVELSKKGEELTWSDFEQYESVDTGSGLYILDYDIDNTFKLLIGGSIDEPPFYIELALKSDLDKAIDIRTEDVSEFIKSNQ